MRLGPLVTDQFSFFCYVMFLPRFGLKTKVCYIDNLLVKILPLKIARDIVEDFFSTLPQSCFSDFALR